MTCPTGVSNRTRTRVHVHVPSWDQVCMHDVSALEHNHMWAILKKHLTPKLITITVTSSRMQTVSEQQCNKAPPQLSPTPPSDNMVVGLQCEPQKLSADFIGSWDLL